MPKSTSTATVPGAEEALKWILTAGSEGRW